MIIVGTGTSQHAAELGVMMLEPAGRDARWFPASTWARWSAGARPGDALVVISHTGADRVRRPDPGGRAGVAGCPLVSITGTGAGWPEAIQTVAHEEAETYTVSYTAALAVLARLAHHVAGADERPGVAPPTCAGRRSRPREIRVDPAPATGHVPCPARSLGIVGCGPWG